MQVDEKRACPSCGAENGPEADFCWKCYARFVPPPPPPGRPGMAGIPGFGRMPQPEPAFQPTAVPPTTSRGGGSSIVKALIGVAVAAVAAFAVHAVFFAGGAHLPDSVAGRPRLTTQSAKDFEKDMKDIGARDDLDVVAGAYGNGAQPDFLVMLVSGRSVESTDQLFDDFVGGIEKSGATVDRTGDVAETHDGTDYRCVPVSGNDTTAAACMWREDGSVGIVLDTTESVKGAEATTWQVHDAATG
ncbi:MAG TPA: hypothetical protein VK646_00485 [Actinomycetota bacterium]|nr:hypothetical protein [Actinomycetota bacterium]